jgi:hypothetical protein
MHENYILKIDFDKIDQSKLFPGKKGRYLDVAILALKQEGKYGDTHIVVQSVSKEARERGEKGQIIGNAKPMPRRGEGQAHSDKAPAKPAPDEDLPF